MDVTNSKNYISGFYHDLQKQNRLLSVTLHPSTELIDGKWKNVESSNSLAYSVSLSEGGGIIAYRKKPIATAILKEDFTVAVSNSWTDFSGGDTLNSIWNSLRPFAGYAKYADKKLGEMQAQQKDLENDPDIMASTVAKWFMGGINKIRPYVKKGTDYLNRALITQGNRFSYYAGTGTGFGNLAMKFVVFADWQKEIIDDKETGNYKFVGVNEQLEELYPYMMGEYVPWDEKDKNNLLNEFIGWQKPPGGFEADVKNVDNFNKGTLMLNFGGYYSIPNIVIKDCQMVFSKQMVKNPNQPNKISPLSCEVQLTLQAATKFTDRMLKEFVNGKYTKTTIEEIEKKLANNLNAINEENMKITPEAYERERLRNLDLIPSTNPSTSLDFEYEPPEPPSTNIPNLMDSLKQDMMHFR